MLTRRERAVFEFCCAACAALHAFPFTWTRIRCPPLTSPSIRTGWPTRLSTALSLRQRLGVAFGVVSTGLHVAFLAARFVPGCGYEPSDFNPMKYAMALHLLHLVSTGATFSAQLAMLASTRDVACLINQLLSCADREQLRRDRATATRERLLLVLSAGYATLSACAVVLCAVLPHNKHVLHSVVPTRWVSPWSLVLFTALQAYTATKCVVETGFLVYAGLAYISTNRAWLKGVHAGFSLSRQLRLYAHLRLLNTLYNNAFGPFLYPTYKTAMEGGGLFFAYIVLKTHWSPETVQIGRASCRERV